MESTVLLSKVFGVFFLIAGALIFLRRAELMIAVRAMFEERFAQFLAGLITIIGGLFFINLYQEYSSLPSILLSIIAWLILIKGILYVFLPKLIISKFTRGLLNQNSWYTMDGILALAFGLYLTGFGYGFWY